MMSKCRDVLSIYYINEFPLKTIKINKILPSNTGT